MKLENIIESVNVCEIKGNVDKEIAGIQMDSRLVEAGHLFVAVKGTQTDGHAYIEKAIEKGASAIVCETLPDTLNEHVTYIRVADTEDAVGKLATTFYGDPTSKLDLVGVTGTNGKTTTTALLGKIMSDARPSVFVVGNIGTPYTSKSLEMTDETVTVAEISSFQLETIWRFAPRVSAILNITEDHLNRHHTMEEYIRVKELITENQGTEDVCVLNYEDEVLREFGKHLAPRVVYFSSGRKLDEGIYLDGNKIILKDGEKEIEAETLIISTGATAKYLGLEDEKKYAGMGVSACATCDGFFYRKKVVAVVGGGDTACEEAVYLAGLASKVYLIVRKPFLRASKIMQERVMNHEKIEVLFEHNAVGLYGDNGVEGVNLVKRWGEPDEERYSLPIDGFFLAIGHQPNSDIFKDYLDTDEVGYIITDGASPRTKVPGVFAAGDVADPYYRQAITAAGSGCKAAIEAERYLSAKGLI